MGRLVVQLITCLVAASVPSTVAYDYFRASGGCDTPTINETLGDNGSEAMQAYVTCLQCQCSNYNSSWSMGVIEQAFGEQLDSNGARPLVRQYVQCRTLAGGNTCTTKLRDTALGIPQLVQFLTNRGFEWFLDLQVQMLCPAQIHCCPSYEQMDAMSCSATRTTSTTTTTTTTTFVETGDAATMTRYLTAMIVAASGLAALL